MRGGDAVDTVRSIWYAAVWDAVRAGGWHSGSLVCARLFGGMGCLRRALRDERLVKLRLVSERRNLGYT